MIALRQKTKHGIIGSIWFGFGVFLLGYLVFFTTPNTTSIPQAVLMGESPQLIIIPTAAETSTPISVDNALGRMVMYSDLKVSGNEMTFRLNDEYRKSFELFKTKTFSGDVDYGKKFEKFINDMGFSIDENGSIVDATKRSVDPAIIECHVVGFFPDKPYIKPNC